MGCHFKGRRSVILSLALGLTGLLALSAHATPTTVRVELTGNSAGMNLSQLNH
jgi:hypothetical protein